MKQFFSPKPQRSSFLTKLFFMTVLHKNKTNVLSCAEDERAAFQQTEMALAASNSCLCSLENVRQKWAVLSNEFHVHPMLCHLRKGSCLLPSQQWQKQLSHWLHTPRRCFCWLFLSSNACWELWSLHKSKILLCFSMLKSFMYAWHEVCTRLNGPITTSWKDLFLNCCIFISKLLTRKPDNCSVWRRHPCL